MSVLTGSAGTGAFSRIVRWDLYDTELEAEAERIRWKLCRYDWQDPDSRDTAGIPSHVYRNRNGAICVRYEPFFGEESGWDYAYCLVPLTF